jgi:hypothetical protein
MPHRAQLMLVAAWDTAALTMARPSSSEVIFGQCGCAGEEEELGLIRAWGMIHGAGQYGARRESLTTRVAPQRSM